MPSFCIIDRESSTVEHGSRIEERAVNLLTEPHRHFNNWHAQFNPVISLDATIIRNS